MSDPPEGGRLRPSGGYRRLRAFQASTVAYDGTVWFCDRFIDKRSRTHDQMVQAARSGRQNIGEGSRAAGTSSESELKLLGVARNSLEELLLDYEDYLRQRRHRQWHKDDPEALEVRAVSGAPWKPATGDDRALVAAYAKWLDPQQPDPVAMANALICVIHQANYLLDQDLAALERDFIKNGGYRESLAAARLAARSAPTTAPPQSPSCPLCQKPMALRTARRGKNAGKQFWGCSGYPDCSGIIPV